MADASEDDDRRMNVMNAWIESVTFPWIALDCCMEDWRMAS